MSSQAAPGRLELVRSFVNTIEPEEEMDLLQADGELPAWCEQTALCPGVDQQGLARLREFREALRGVLEGHAEGEAGERWAAMEPFASRSSYILKVGADGRPMLKGQGDGADAAIAELLGIAYDAIGQGMWRRLKACRKHSCRWAFYDRSKNGSGAWCSMRVCGNRVKAQRRRARRKAD
jgi:predicted RNA-binding Zn ribbon-like protein